MTTYEFYIEATGKSTRCTLQEKTSAQGKAAKLAQITGGNVRLTALDDDGRTTGREEWFSA